MKNFKQAIKIVFFTICFIFSANSSASNYINDAKQYMDKGEYQSAIIQLKNQLKEKPKNAQARFLLGTAYLKTGDVKQADKEITRAYQIDPANEDIILAYAQILLFKKDYTKVHKILNKKFSDIEKEQQRQIYNAYAFIGLNQLADAKAILSQLESQVENVQVYNALAKIAVLESELDLANQWLEKSLKMEPENTNALQTRAIIEITNNKYSKALSIYNNLIQKQKNNLILYLKRAAIKIRLNDLQGAEKDIHKVLGKVKNQPHANYMLAQIKLQEGNYKEAKVAAQNVLNVMPYHYNSMMILGISHFVQGNYNLADKYLTQYLSEIPTNIVVQNILANVYLAQNKGDQALLILENIDERKRNNNAKILMTMGSAYLLTGEHQKGIDTLNKAMQLAPDSIAIQKKLVEEQFKTGNINGVISGLEKIVDSEQANPKTNYLLIISYIQKKELQKAEKKLNELIQKKPDDPALYNLNAIVQKLKGNIQKAKKTYKQVLQLNEKFIPAYLGLAELATLEKNWKLAKAYYSKVTQINPNYVKSYIYLAAIAEKQNHQKEIERQLKIALEQSKGDIKSQLAVAGLLSKLYVHQKTPEKILPIAQDLIREYPSDKAALSFLSMAQIANKKNAQAEQTLKNIINNNGSDVKHRLLLATLLAKKKGNESEVLELLDSTINIMPNEPKLVVYKVDYLLKNKQFQQVIDVANYAEKQFPKLALGYLLKGDIYRLENQLDKALSNYQAAYKLQPKKKLLFIISDLLSRQGKESEALKLLDGELKNNDKDLKIHFKIASIYQKDKQYDIAVKHYLKMLEIQEDNLLALNNLAWIYAQEKKPEALSLARKAYEKAPESAVIIDTYGYIQLKQGDIIEAIKLLEQAVKLAPKAYDIKYHLAEGYHLKGDNKKAKTLLTSLLNENIEFSEKKNAMVLFNQLQ